MKTETIIAAAAGLAVGYFAFRKTDAAVGKLSKSAQTIMDCSLLKRAINERTYKVNIGFNAVRGGTISIYTTDKNDGRLLHTIGHYKNIEELKTVLESINNFQISVE